MNKVVYQELVCQAGKQFKFVCGMSLECGHVLVARRPIVGMRYVSFYPKGIHLWRLVRQSPLHGYCPEFRDLV